MPKFRDPVYKKLPAVLADIVRDYVRPEYELAKLQKKYECEILILGEIEPEILEHLPENHGMFSIRWILYTADKITITYDPEIFDNGNNDDDSDSGEEYEDYDSELDDVKIPKYKKTKNGIMAEMSRDVSWEFRDVSECSECDCKLMEKIMVSDIAPFYIECGRESKTKDERAWKYDSLEKPINYRIMCLKCSGNNNILFDKHGKRYKKGKLTKKSTYFVRKIQNKPIMSMMKIIGSIDSWHLFYHRGFKRDKYQRVDVESEEDEFRLHRKVYKILELDMDIYEYVKFLCEN